jgi:hypothetical protein
MEMADQNGIYLMIRNLVSHQLHLRTLSAVN